MSLLLRRFARVEARLEPFSWAWRHDHQDLIAEHWRSRWSGNPAVFNGRVLMASGLEQAGETLQARFFETDYAAMIAWIAQGFPGEPVWNGFAMGALRCRDGGYLLGRMAPRTANAGKLYFPCGTPDPSDCLVGGEVDLTGSIVREIAEETGLSPDCYALETDWRVVEDGGHLAFIRRGSLALTGAETRARVTAHLAAEDRPELAGIEIVSRAEDADETAIPGVVTAYLRAAFATGTAA